MRTSSRIIAKSCSSSNRSAPCPELDGDQRVAERLEHRLERAQVLGLVVDEQDRQRLDRREVGHRLGVGDCGAGAAASGPNRVYASSHTRIIERS